MLSVSPLYWDPDGDPANNLLETGTGLGGSGSWNASSPLWYDPATNSHVAWDSTARAVFTGTSGNVTVATGIAADSLAFASGGYTLAGGSLQLSGAPSGASSIDVGASLTSTIATQLVGSVTLAKTGAGSLTLSAANTYTGGTTISGGTLRLANTSGAGSGAIQIGDAALSLFRGGSTTTYPNAITSLAGTAGTLLLDGSGSNAGTGTNSTYATGSINVHGSLTVSRPAGGNGHTVFSGLLAGGGTLVVDNTNGGAAPSASALGRAQFNSTGNTFSGSLAILDGGNFLNLKTSAVYAGADIAAGGYLTILGGTSTTLRTLTGAGRVTKNNAANLATLVVGQGDASGTFSGVIAQNLLTATGTVALAKVGAGTLTLSGANTYTGGTTIEAGTLDARGSGSTSILGTGPVAVQAGAALRITNTASSARTVANAISGPGSVQFASTGTPTSTTFRTHVNGSITSFSGDFHVLPSGNFAAWTTSPIAPVATTTQDVSVDAGGLLLVLCAAGTPTTSFGGLSGGGTVSTNAGTSSSGILSVGQGGADGAFSGLVTQNLTSGSLLLTKVGAGTFTFSGQQNATGVTTIAEGELRVAGGGEIAAGIVEAGGVLTSDAAWYQVDIGAFTKGESAATSAGWLSTYQPLVAAHDWLSDWRGAIEGRVTGSATGPNHSGAFPGPFFRTGAVAGLRTVSGNSLPGLGLADSQKLIVWEDWTDNDWDDAYWTITATPLAFIVDLDVDSNNDEQIAEADDPIEELSPGKLVLFESGPVEGDLFRKMYSPTEVSTRVEFSEALSGYVHSYLVLRNQAEGLGATIRVWADEFQDVLFEVADGVISLGAGQLTDSVWIEGIAEGTEILELVTEYTPSGASPIVVAQDSVLVNVKKAPQVVDVVFRQVSAAHYGDLEISTNPDGASATEEGDDAHYDANGVLRFMGGDRLFPDAKSVEDNNVANNIVRVRAILENVTDDDVAAALNVYFRACDVDDPSTNATIDPNGNGAEGGRDNRGRLTDIAFEGNGSSGGSPKDSVAPLSDGPGFEGHLRTIDADGNPGVWQAQKATVEAVIRKQGNVYYAEVDLATSFAPGDNLRVGATFNEDRIVERDYVPTADDHRDGSPQLSVWRRFHVEQDRMASTTSADSVQGNITEVAAVGGASGQAQITTDIRHIENHPLLVNQFVGGILRHNGKNYHILANTAGGDDGVVFEVIGAPASFANGAVTVYEDDFSPIEKPMVELELARQGQLVNAGGTLRTLTPERFGGQAFPMAAQELVGGVLLFSLSTDAFQITANTTTTITFDIGNAAEPEPASFLLYRPLGAAVPETIVDPSQDADGMYDLLQATANLNQNKFAIAYLQPVLSSLDSFDSDPNEANTLVSATPHLSNVVQEAETVLNPYRGSHNVETPLFWVVYVSTGYETIRGRGGDPSGEGYAFGSSSLNMSVIYLEAIRDFSVDHPALSELTGRARVTVHEIAHQFDVARTNSGHRPSESDIMFEGLAPNIEDKAWNFHVVDIAWLRSFTKSPSSGS